MTFTSVEFAYFWPVAFVCYWLLPRRAEWQNGALLVLSYAFYWAWHPAMIALLAATTLVDYGLGRGLGGLSRGHRLRPWLLRASILWNVGLLIYFKYLGFLTASFAALLEGVGLKAPLPVLDIALPLGISYFTLQKLSYIIDIYYGRMGACRSLPRFATAVAFFPHLVAGPVTRPAALLPQLESARRLRPEDLSTAAALFLFGFLQKACLADNLALTLVDPVFARPGEFTAGAHWLAALGYTVQVFCDFAGYSLMALGVARGFGLHLPRNFDRPFLSLNLNELWRRWHISLNTWIFEYIYTPLTTGTGFFRGRLELGFLLVFMISGLWHGASWGFVLWGTMHGLGLVAVHRWDEFYRGLCRKDRAWVARRRSMPYKAAAWALTLGFFVLSLIPFRLGDGEGVVAFLFGLTPGHGSEQLALGTFAWLSVVGFAFGVVVLEHLLGLPRLAPLWTLFLRVPAPLRGVAYGLILVYMAVLLPETPGIFIYARF